MILSPGHDRVVTIESGNFSIAKVYFCIGVFLIICQGFKRPAHSSVHASFIMRRFQLPKGFLGLKIQIARILLIQWNEARLPYRQETSHSLLPIAGNHRLSLLVNLSSLYYHSLGPIHFHASILLSRKHAPFRCERC